MPHRDALSCHTSSPSWWSVLAPSGPSRERADDGKDDRGRIEMMSVLPCFLPTHSLAAPNTGPTQQYVAASASAQQTRAMWGSGTLCKIRILEHLEHHEPAWAQCACKEERSSHERAQGRQSTHAESRPLQHGATPLLPPPPPARLSVSPSTVTGEHGLGDGLGSSSAKMTCGGSAAFASTVRNGLCSVGSARQPAA